MPTRWSPTWIDAEGHRLHTVSGGGEHGAITKLPKQVDYRRNHYDYAALYNRLVKLKTARPTVATATVRAASSVPFDVVAKTLDTLRWRLEQEAYEDSEDFHAARINWSPKRPSATDMFTTLHLQAGKAPTAKVPGS